jgi:hypothetical protein
MNYEQRTIDYCQLPTGVWHLSTVLGPLHLSRTLYKFTPFFAKQTQFAEYSNERKWHYNKGL